MPTPCTVTGTLNQLTGGLIGQGRVLFQLTNLGTGNPIGVTGTSIIPQLTYTIVTAQNGTFTVSLWGNDNINPANTLYSVTFFDSLGNSMGPVLYSITGASVNLNTAVAANTTSPPILVGGPAIVSAPLAPQSITGQSLTLTSTAPLNVQSSIQTKNLENVLYVDPTTCLANWGSSDVGAACNAAYAALPSSGGTICVVGGTIASPTSFAIPIVFGTGNKPVLMLGLSGAVWKFTPASGTAISLNWGGVGEGWCGVRDLTLLGSGSGNTAKGISVASRVVTISGLKIASSTSATGDGFGTGIEFTSNGFTSLVEKSLIAQCTTGINWTGATEGTRISYSVFSHCGTICNSPTFGGTNDVTLVANSYDDSLTVGFNLGGGANFVIKGGHFEDFDFANGSVTQYATLTSNAILVIDGATMFTDRTTGTQAQWITAGGSSYVRIVDTDVASAGATVTQVVNFSSTARGFLNTNHTTANITNDYNVGYVGAPVWVQTGSGSQALLTCNVPIMIQTPGSSGTVGSSLINFSANSSNTAHVAFEAQGTARFTVGLPTNGNLWSIANNDDTMTASPLLTLDVGGNQTLTQSLKWKETTSPGGAANLDIVYADSTAHALLASYNNDTFKALTRVIASGTSTLTSNAALVTVTSQTAITTAAAGALTTDAIEWAYASAPGAGDSLCHISAYVTSGNVNFVRSNPTAASQSVSALVINWRVVR